MHFTDEQRESWAGTTRGSGFNCWLRDRVTDRLGALDLAALARVAAEFDIDSSAYAHLNPGQQRMNVGNRLRKVVPPSIYRSYDEPVVVASNLSPTVDTMPPDAPPPLAASTASGVPPGASDLKLMQLYGAVIEELRARNIVRTGNAPLGDYAEHLFAKAFGWTLEGNSTAGYDATDGAGLFFQIKARRLRVNTPGERQLSVLRALPNAKFDVLAAVLFDRQFGVSRAALIPYHVVLGRAVYIARVNGWRLILDDAVWLEPGVRDVTAALAAA